MQTSKAETQPVSFQRASLFNRLRQEWVGVLVLLLLAGFPFLFAWFSGTSVTDGPSLLAGTDDHFLHHGSICHEL